MTVVDCNYIYLILFSGYLSYIEVRDAMDYTLFFQFPPYSKNFSVVAKVASWALSQVNVHSCKTLSFPLKEVLAEGRSQGCTSVSIDVYHGLNPMPPS